MDHQRRGYLAYLLRLWQTGDSQPPAWRVSLEDPRSGQRLGFGDLESAFVFLREQIHKQEEAPKVIKPHPWKDGR